MLGCGSVASGPPAGELGAAGSSGMASEPDAAGRGGGGAAGRAGAPNDPAAGATAGESGNPAGAAGLAGTGGAAGGGDPCRAPRAAVIEWSLDPADEDGPSPPCAVATWAGPERARVESSEVFGGGLPLPARTRLVVSLVDRVPLCRARIVLRTEGSRFRFDQGETLKVAIEASGGPGALRRALGIADDANKLIFGGVVGASSVDGGVESLQGLQMGSVGEPTCAPSTDGAVPARLWRGSESCPVAPHGVACCQLLGATYEVSMRGAFKQGGARVADFLLASPDRLVEPLPGGLACEGVP